MTRFDGQTLLITGASSGIGRACASRLAREGAATILWTRDADRVAPEAVEGPHRVQVVDVTDENAVRTAIRSLKGEGVELAGIVHSAGAHAVRPLSIETADKLLALFQTNVGSVFSLTRAAVAAGVMRSPSSVTIISSQAASRGSAATSAYAATKGALEAVVRCWAVELVRRGIRVNAVSPGVVRTPMTEKFFSVLSQEQRAHVEARHLLGLGESEDVAAAVAFLASADARWITGTVLTVDGGFSAW